MKRFLILLILLGSFQLGAQNIYNSSFEEWNIGGFIQKPTGWSTSNEYTALQGVYTVSPDSIAYAGNYSVKIKTFDVGTPPTPYPGFVVNGQLLPTGTNDFSKLLFAGEPFPYKPKKLIGYYKFTSNSPIEDWAYAYVLLKKYDSNSHTTVNIGFGSNTFLNPTTQFTYFEVPITYNIQGQIPDSVVVAFFSSYPQSPISGGELWVDKVSFDYTGSIDEDINNFKIYPNPALDFLHIEQKPNKAEFNIYDIHGQLIKSGMITDQKTQIDISEFKKGFYFFQMNSSKRRITQTFMKE